MKLQNINSMINLGDKSFTRQDYMESFPMLLKVLYDFNFDAWEKNKPVQVEYYERVLKDTDLFQRDDKDEASKRSRTLTNAMIKIGLINEKREVSETAIHWIEGTSAQPDNFESVYNFQADNLVFWRQLIKLRVYVADSTQYIKPFIFALKFLAKYENVLKKDFLAIFLNIKPIMSLQTLDEIYTAYEEVVKGESLFSDYFAKYFSDYLRTSDSELMAAKNWFDGASNEDEFIKIFGRGGTPKSTLKKYYSFINSLKIFRSKKDLVSLKKLMKQSSLPANKKAFGYRKNPFITKNNVVDFLEANADSVYLNGNGDDIYKEYRLSKNYDLRLDYGDNTLRYLNLSGVIQDNGNTLSLTILPFFKVLFSSLKIDIFGNEKPELFEEEIHSDFFNDISTMQILELTESDFEVVIKKLNSLYHISSMGELRDKLENQKDTEFINFINDKFNKETTIKILKEIQQRQKPGDVHDLRVQDMVTKHATVPTIFEFILGIAWYHLSNGKLLKIRRFFNLALGGDMLPLRHADGGQGDIEVLYDDKSYNLLLEATIMDKNAQKQGELEPIIRHTTNLNIEYNEFWYGMFVGNVLDESTINIFHAVQWVELHYSRDKSRSVPGIGLFALTIKELTELLEHDISDIEIISAFENELRTKPTNVSSDWREPIIESLLGVMK
ncbi:AlwI family type II restriction endonuclease [Weissella paramesenteroides]